MLKSLISTDCHKQLFLLCLKPKGVERPFFWCPSPDSPKGWVDMLFLRDHLSPSGGHQSQWPNMGRTSQGFRALAWSGWLGRSTPPARLQGLRTSMFLWTPSCCACFLLCEHHSGFISLWYFISFCHLNIAYFPNEARCFLFPFNSQTGAIWLTAGIPLPLDAQGNELQYLPALSWAPET